MDTAATPLPNGLSVLVEESGDVPYIPAWPQGHDLDDGSSAQVGTGRINS